MSRLRCTCWLLDGAILALLLIDPTRPVVPIWSCLAAPLWCWRACRLAGDRPLLAAWIIPAAFRQAHPRIWVSFAFCASMVGEVAGVCLVVTVCKDETGVGQEDAN